jgi:antitoxin YefM
LLLSAFICVHLRTKKINPGLKNVPLVPGSITTHPSTFISFLLGWHIQYASPCQDFTPVVLYNILSFWEAVMQARTYSEARHDLKNVMDEACNNHEPILITRRKGESVVILSLEDYESIMESEYLLSSPANAARLLKSLEESRAGKRTSMDALEL